MDAVFYWDRCYSSKQYHNLTRRNEEVVYLDETKVRWILFSLLFGSVII